MEIPSDGKPRKRGRPRREDAPDPRTIRSVALARFARDGFHATSLRDIAADARVDVALVSRQFGSKIELWKAVVDDVAGQLADVHAQIAALDAQSMALPDRIAWALDRFVAFNTAHPELGQFFVNQVTRPGERRAYVLERLWLPNRSTFLPLLQEGIAAGIVPVKDAELALIMLIGAVALPLLTADIVTQDVGSRLEARLLDGVTALFVSSRGRRP